jgi:O-methyltransferase
MKQNPMDSNAKSAYLELLKKDLIDHQNIGSMEYHPLSIVNPNWKTFFLYPLDRFLRKRNFSINKLIYVDKEKRMNGMDWPANAKTMIGYKRLSNIEGCIRAIVKDNIEGDLIEAGVWRGGATIFMKAVLNELNITDKIVWLADSFQGLPKPKKEFTVDRVSKLHKQRILTVSKKEVENNFRHYDLLDNKVKFIEGWFDETLPDAPIDKLSLLRLDGDLYESTIIALESLYPKLTTGGFIIIDDYNAFEFCKKAVLDYRLTYNIKEEIIEIDKEAVFWRKEK